MNYINVFNFNKYFQSLNINTKSIKFKEIKQQETIEKFIEEIYNNAYLNIGKAGIQIKKVNENEILFYNTEIPMNKTSYIISDIMLSVSSFLKNEYGINGIIFPEITYTNENNEDTTIIITSVFLGAMALVTYNIYIGFVVADIVKEKKNGMKHLLYLSGVNMFSYWFSFFIFHFCKLVLIILIMSLSIYLVSDAVVYIFSLLFLASFSSLFFYYSLTKYIEKEETVINLFSLLIIFIAIFGYLITLIFDLNLYGLFISPDYNIIDIFPMTSQIKGCYSFTITYYNKRIASNSRIIKTIVNQMINFVIYLLLMILTEKNIFEKGFNYIKVKLFIKDSNVIFSNEQINE